MIIDWNYGAVYQATRYYDYDYSFVGNWTINYNVYTNPVQLLQTGAESGLYITKLPSSCKVIYMSVGMPCCADFECHKA